MGFQQLFCVSLLCWLCVVEGIGCNWGTRSTHPLPASIVVRMLKDNGFKKVKLFEADPQALKALGNSGIEVMVGIPNELLAPLASRVEAAEEWVMRNVSSYVSKNGVDIRYVAVGNEPFLKGYNGTYQNTTLPALQNIQTALVKAGLGRQVKVTVPLNADVYETDTGVPSGGNFRPDILNDILPIIKLLNDSNSPFTVNIYPFLSLYLEPDFPIDYAFFAGTPTPVVDGPITYTNVFDANLDTLVSALEKNGFASMEIVVGEIGWPTDGDRNANLNYARKFNQGLMDRVNLKQGTPKRSNPPEIYLFGLIDEDAKSVAPGNFERHWGIFNFDGTAKYPLDLSHSGRSLVPAKNVKYLARQWCILSPSANILAPNFTASVEFACTYADCTSLGYGSSCNGLDARGNASYAFNVYYQTANQQNGACEFSNLSVITRADPSQKSCQFEIMIDLTSHETSPTSPRPVTGAAPRTVTGAAGMCHRNPVAFLSMVLVYALLVWWK